MQLPFHKEYPDFAGSIDITTDLKAVVIMDEMRATVNLMNVEEAEQLVKEIEDPDGELGYQEGSILGKYPDLRQFRP